MCVCVCVSATLMVWTAEGSKWPGKNPFPVQTVTLAVRPPGCRQRLSELCNGKKGTRQQAGRRSQCASRYRAFLATLRRMQIGQRLGGCSAGRGLHRIWRDWGGRVEAQPTGPGLSHGLVSGPGPSFGLGLGPGLGPLLTPVWFSVPVSVPVLVSFSVSISVSVPVPSHELGHRDLPLTLPGPVGFCCTRRSAAYAYRPLPVGNVSWFILLGRIFGRPVDYSGPGPGVTGDILSGQDPRSGRFNCAALLGIPSC